MSETTDWKRRRKEGQLGGGRVEELVEVGLGRRGREGAKRNKDRFECVENELESARNDLQHGSIC